MHSHRTSTGFKMHIDAFPTESPLQIRIFLRTVYNLSCLPEQRRKNHIKPSKQTNKKTNQNPKHQCFIVTNKQHEVLELHSIPIIL